MGPLLFHPGQASPGSLGAQETLVFTSRSSSNLSVQDSSGSGTIQPNQPHLSLFSTVQETQLLPVPWSLLQPPFVSPRRAPISGTPAPSRRPGFMDVRSVQLYKSLHLEGPHAWFNTLLMPSRNLKSLNKGPPIFILSWAPQIIPQSCLPLLPSGPPQPHLPVEPSPTQEKIWTGMARTTHPPGRSRDPLHIIEAQALCHLGRMAQELPGDVENRKRQKP